MAGPSSAKTRTYPCGPPRRRAAGQHGDRFRIVTGGGQGQGAQSEDLDQTAVAALGRGGGFQPVEQDQRRSGIILGEQQPGQDQVAWLARIVKRAVGPQTLISAPPGHLGHVSLGQQQPGPLRRDRVEQPGGARGERLRLRDGLRRPVPVAGRLADPGQEGQPGRQRRGVDELTAQRRPPDDVIQRPADVVALVRHLGQADERGPGGRPQARPRLARPWLARPRLALAPAGPGPAGAGPAGPPRPGLARTSGPRHRAVPGPAAGGPGSSTPRPWW